MSELNLSRLKSPRIKLREGIMMSKTTRILHLENRIKKLSVHPIENENLIRKAKRQLRKLTE